MAAAAADHRAWAGKETTRSPIRKVYQKTTFSMILLEGNFCELSIHGT